MDQLADYFHTFTFSRAAWIALAEVILIDITLAGDNAVVIGLTAARVAPHHRGRVIFWGLLGAVVLRILLAFCAVWLLNILGMTFAGGIILLWVSWRLYRDILESKLADAHGADAAPPKHVSLLRAVSLIVVADLSMSLDNVLAVAGVAQPVMATDPWVLVVGLALSIALMGAAAVVIARVLKRFPWVAYVGVAIIAYAAVRMIVEGGGEIFKAMHAL